jgi:hypothetical protein
MGAAMWLAICVVDTIVDMKWRMWQLRYSIRGMMIFTAIICLILGALIRIVPN